MSLLLNTGAMHYRENVNDEWKPLVIKANADLTVLADEYSNASTYVVGEYCRYDGQLYRCTTAITTAESWTPAHWTETNIGDELESIKDDVSDLNTAATSKVLYFTNVSVTAKTGNIVDFSNAAITNEHVLAECVFANPLVITTDLTWTTTAGNLKLNGTATGSTTANVVLVKKDN